MAMIRFRPALMLGIVLLAAFGCADVPDRTPKSDPIEIQEDDPADAGAIPTPTGARRIETH
jgi:hypothetical protein